MDLLEKMVELDNMPYQDEDELASINQKFDELLRSYFEMPQNSVDSFVSHMDLVLKHTDSNNIFWPLFIEIYDHPLFYQSFANNIKYLKSGFHIEKLIHDICKLSDTNRIFDYKEVLEYLMNDKYTEMLWVEYLTFMSNSQQITFLNLIIEKQIKIDFILTYNVELPEEVNEYIIKHIKDFISLSSNIFALKDYFKNNEEITIMINKYINRHPSIISKSVINYIKRLDKQNNEKENFETILEMLIAELVANEKTKYSDIEINANGSINLVLMVKDKVLKLCKQRRSEVFPNNPYIIKPLLRRNFIFQDEEIFVEITERANTTKKVNQDELYELYKGFRELGLVWTDINKSNVGFLNKDNIIHWHEDLNPSDEVLNLEPMRGKDILLKKGDLVVTDADFIYKEEDKKDIIDVNSEDFVLSLSFLNQVFENKYQDEKKLTLK